MSKSINKKYKFNSKEILTADQYLDGIKKGNSQILSEAFTLLESNNKDKRKIANEILSETSNSNNSIRIGITGSPGVGKSSFIETFGLMLCSKGYRVAVLAIDPSSQQSGGSILGDKTRMEKLGANNNAFIRPSPSKGFLGGVAKYTNDTILLCETAAFDIIIIETVGVGQSETDVHKMVDFFLLLVLAGAGDELQGIKRGIMELADGVIITKADGNNKKLAEKAKSSYNNILNLIPKDEKSWKAIALSCSAIDNTGIYEVWEMIEKFNKSHSKSRRSSQNIYWMMNYIENKLKDSFFTNSKVHKQTIKIKKQVEEGSISPFIAAKILLKTYNEA